jgi:hypothetical protein
MLELIYEDLGQACQTPGKAVTSTLLGADQRVGVDRLIEALECTMWSNMMQKQ